MKKALLLILLATLMGIIACDSDLIFPEADFEFTRINGKVEFENTSTYAEQFYWDFGNGTNSEEKNPVTYYIRTGDYDVSLQAKTGTLDGTRQTKKIKITQTSYWNLIFFNENNSYNELVIYVDGEMAGKLIGVYDIGSGRTCAGVAPGRLNVPALATVEHHFEVKTTDGKSISSGTFSSRSRDDSCGIIFTIR